MFKTDADKGEIPLTSEVPIEYPFKFKQSTSKRFLSEKLKDHQKMKLYTNQRFHNMDSFKNQVSKSSNEFPLLINVTSPFKHKRADSVKIKEMIEAKNIGMGNRKSSGTFNTISNDANKFRRSSSGGSIFNEENSTLARKNSLMNLHPDTFQMGQINTYTKLYNLTDNTKKFNDTFLESFNQHNEYRHNDLDIRCLLDQYTTPCDDTKIFKKDDDLAINMTREYNRTALKYRLNKEIDPHTKLQITAILAKKGIKLDGNNYVSLHKDEIQSSCNNEYYNNPFKSGECLVNNEKIFNNVMNIRMEKQINCFRQKYNDIKSEEYKVKLMPLVKITSMNKKKKAAANQFDDDVPGEQNVSNFQERYSVGEKREMSREAQLANATDIPGVFLKNGHNRPSSRCSFPVVADEYSNEVFIFGGLNSVKLDDLWKLQVQEYPITTDYKWKQLRPIVTEKFYPRFGHSMTFYNKQLVIFGGCLDYDPLEHEFPREDILLYDIDDNRLYSEKCFQKSELKFRRNHIAEQIGVHMLIYGGIDDRGNYLSDMWILDLTSYIWQRVEPRSNIKTPAVAYHSSCMVFTSDKKENSNFKIFNFNDIPQGKAQKKLKNEGLYIFGGMDEDKVIRSDIKYLKLGKKPIEWIIPKTDGQGPSPRISASMSYYEDLNILIVHGGTDRDKKTFYKDLYLFDIDKLRWAKVMIYNGLPEERCEHNSFMMHSKFIIFGGLNQKKYIGSELYILDFDTTIEKKPNALTRETKTSWGLGKKANKESTKQLFQANQERRDHDY